MSETPPRPTAAKFLHAAIAVLVGSIALYLSVQLLRSILLPLMVAGGVAAAVWLVWLLRRLQRPRDW